MKILYGVQATGNGHISRSREIIRELKREGHEIIVLFSGRDEKLLWAVEDFQPYIVRRGLTFVTENGRIKVLKTIFQVKIVRLLQDIFSLDISGFDLIITDFEPVTAYAAKLRKKLSLGIGHQYAFRYKIPFPRFEWLSALILRWFGPADVPLGLHWHHYHAPILPPVIPSHFLNIQTVFTPHKIVVYLPFEIEEKVMKILNSIEGYEFYFYCSATKANDAGFMHQRPFSREGFLKDLLSCEGVITNGGFELPSEALHLGKKLLVCPVQGQSEQIANGLALDQLKLGSVMKKLNRPAIINWLDQPLSEAKNYPNVAGAIARWISIGDYSAPEILSQTLWTQHGSVKY